MPESIKRFLILFFGIAIAIQLGRLVGGGRSTTVIALLFVAVVMLLAMRYRTVLPALAIGMAWYSGENVFLKLPYVTLILLVFCVGTGVRHLFVQRREAEPLFRSSSVRLGVAALFGMAAILVGVTFFRHVGILPASIYGLPGGLRFALTAMVLCVFTVMARWGLVGSGKFWMIPALALGGAIFNALIDTLNYFIPQTAFFTYYLTTGMSHEVTNVLTGASTTVYRLTALRELGFFLAAYMLCRFVQKRNGGGRRHISGPVLVGLAITGLLVIVSGYRGYVLRFALMCAIMFWVYDRKLMWLGGLAGGALWLGLVSMGRAIASLPPQVQRVIGSIPGVCKTDVALGALSGIEWRADLFSRFFRYEFLRHPWFGRGVIGELDLAEVMFWRDPVRFFEKSQLYHSGIASSLDVVGIVGTSFLVLAQLIALRCCIRLIRFHRQHLNGWAWWCVLYFCASMPLFWYTGFFSRQIPLLWLSALGVYAAYDDTLSKVQREPADDT